MVRAVAIDVPGTARDRRELGAPVTAGGSRADGILLPGAPPRAVRLSAAPAGVVVEARAAGVRVGRHAVPPGSVRLLRPGEQLVVAGASISVAPAAAAEGTRAAASPVLRGEVAGDGAALVVLTGPRAGERHALGDGLTVGRGRAAALRVADPLASRVHLRLRPSAEGATVEDLGSKNGVRVNGVALERGPCTVRPGDEIALGGTLLALEDPWVAEPEDGAPPGAGDAPPSAAPGGPPARVPRALAVALLLALSAAALAAAS